MKYIILILINFFIVSSVISQKNSKYKDEGEMPMVDGKYCYSEVIMLDSVKKDVLFQRARAFANKSFVSYKDVAQSVDKELGELLLKGSTGNLPSKTFGFYAIGCGSVRFSLNIYVKDGRYKYVITDFIHTGTHRNHFDVGALENTKARSMPLREIKRLTKSDIEALILRLKSAMQKSSSESEF